MSKSHYIIPVFVPHEGCPHNCVFCNQDTITGEKNKVDAKFVKDTIEEYLTTIDNNAIIEVSFFGGTFTAIPMQKQVELLEVAKAYKDAKKIDYIHLSTRPDYINEEILENLKKYSVDIIELGVQSLDDEVLLKSGRGHDEKDVIKASNLIKKYGFVLGHQVMLGLPGDNFEKDIETTRKLIDLQPKIARIYPALVIKDTPMEKMYNRGAYSPYTLEQAVEISEKIYTMFVVNGINVIRIGLQPTEEINWGKELVAGPFHPAFRELVESSIYNNMILEQIQQNDSLEFIVHINEKDLSKLYANKKKFFNDMKSEIPTKKIKVQQNKTLPRNEIMLKYNEVCKKITIEEYLQKKYKEGYSIKI